VAGPEALGRALGWSALVIGSYLAARRLQRQHPRWWTSPLLLSPLPPLLAGLALRDGYRADLGGTRWLLLMLGPATVAFALPIFEQRAMIRRHGRVLLAGVLAGSSTSLLTAWWLAHWLGLPGLVRQSLLPRSISTPFAMAASGALGGSPDLTAVFVILTGISGAALGEILLKCLPLRSSTARGALFGMGAHAAGAATAHRLGLEEGSMAGLVMVLAGLLNVLSAPWLARWLH